MINSLSFSKKDVNINNKNAFFEYSCRLTFIAEKIQIAGYVFFLQCPHIHTLHESPKQAFYCFK